MNKDETRSGPKPRAENAISLLTADHDKVKKLFKKYEKLAEKDPNGEKSSVAKEIITELTVHMAVEEEIFYPAARKAINDDDMINEADVEHAGAKSLILELLEMRSNNAMYDAKVTVLGEYIEHHIEEEHDEMFPKVRNTQLDLEALGKKMHERKTALLAASDSERVKVLSSTNSAEKQKARPHRA